MTNVVLLESYIKKSGLKRGKLAEALGISLQAFKKKTNGTREFKASEIKTLCNMLGITDSGVMDRIFFAF